MNFTLRIWRQKCNTSEGQFQDYYIRNISPDISFLELLDILNEDLEKSNQEPIAFDHDCREGICGMCSLFINGKAHGPQKATTTCQLHMRSFKNEDVIVIEPWRARAFPVIKDLVVDRSSFDRIIASGGYISVKTGSAPEANNIAINKEKAEIAMDNAACIGCGACVASCKNSSASLFVAAKISHLQHLPQGKVEEKNRVVNMIKAMDKEGFGHCSNEKECQAACPKEISVKNIYLMNKLFIKNSIK